MIRISGNPLDEGVAIEDESDFDNPAHLTLAGSRYARTRCSFNLFYSCTSSTLPCYMIVWGGSIYSAPLMSVHLISQNNNTLSATKTHETTDFSFAYSGFAVQIHQSVFIVGVGANREPLVVEYHIENGTFSKFPLHFTSEEASDLKILQFLCGLAVDDKTIMIFAALSNTLFRVLKINITTCEVTHEKDGYFHFSRNEQSIWNAIHVDNKIWFPNLFSDKCIDMIYYNLDKKQFNTRKLLAPSDFFSTVRKTQLFFHLQNGVALSFDVQPYLISFYNRVAIPLQTNRREKKESDHIVERFKNLLFFKTSQWQDGIFVLTHKTIATLNIDYLKAHVNDCLLPVGLQYVRKKEPSHVPSDLYDLICKQNNIAKIAEKLNSWSNSTADTTMKLLANEEFEMKIHKCVLASLPGYFREILVDDQLFEDENPILHLDTLLPGVTINSTIMQLILKWLYTRCPITTNLPLKNVSALDLGHLIKIADFCNFQQLKSICINHILDRMQSLNQERLDNEDQQGDISELKELVTHAIHIGYRHNIPTLFNASYHLLVEFEGLRESEQFNELPVTIRSFFTSAETYNKMDFDMKKIAEHDILFFGATKWDKPNTVIKLTPGTARWGLICTSHKFPFSKGFDMELTLQRNIINEKDIVELFFFADSQPQRVNYCDSSLPISLKSTILCVSIQLDKQLMHFRSSNGKRKPLAYPLQPENHRLQVVTIRLVSQIIQNQTYLSLILDSIPIGTVLFSDWLDGHAAIRVTENKHGGNWELHQWTIRDAPSTPISHEKTMKCRVCAELFSFDTYFSCYVHTEGTYVDRSVKPAKTKWMCCEKIADGKKHGCTQTNHEPVKL